MEVKFAQRQGKIELFLTKDEDDGIYNNSITIFIEQYIPTKILLIFGVEAT